MMSRGAWSEGHPYYASLLWKQIRKRRLDFSGHRCELCNSKYTLQVHHSTYARFPGKELMSDLIVLCRPCHEKFHEHKSAMQIASGWIEDAFRCGVLYAIKRPPKHRDYGLFNARGRRVVFRNFDFSTDGYQHNVNLFAGKISGWIESGMPNIPDYDQAKREKREEKERAKHERRAQRRTSVEIWFEDFEPRIRHVMGEG